MRSGGCGRHCPASDWQDWQVKTTPPGNAEHQYFPNTQQRAARGRYTAAILTGTSLAIAAYGKCQWWQDGEALRLAAWYTFGAFAAIEVLDGYCRKWNFSRDVRQHVHERAPGMHH